MVYFKIPVIPKSLYYIKVYIFNDNPSMIKYLSKVWNVKMPDYSAVFSFDIRDKQLGTMAFSRERLSKLNVNHECVHAMFQISRHFKLNLKKITEDVPIFQRIGIEEFHIYLATYLEARVEEEIKKLSIPLVQDKYNADSYFDGGANYYCKNDPASAEIAGLMNTREENKNEKNYLPIVANSNQLHDGKT